jgi:uncharacterized phage-associated protein
MPYPAKAVANYFLDLAEEAGKGLDPMKIQKLVYFAHGWHLALTGAPLLEEQIEAWQYGPVVPTLYHGFKQWGGGAIQGRAIDWRLDINPATGRKSILRSVSPSLDDYGDDEKRNFAKSVVKRVWEVYGSWSAVQLSQLTHVPDGPWDATRRENPDRKGTDIPDQLIRDYFVGKATRKDEHSGAGTA